VDEQFPPPPGCETLSQMPIFEEPVPKSQAAQLRRAVLKFRSHQPKRVFATTVHIGDPDGYAARYTHSSADISTTLGQQHPRATRLKPPTPLDHAQRADLIGVLIDDYILRTPGRAPLMWLTRSGDVGHAHDVDHAWLAAGHLAFAESRVPFTMFVISPQGWYDPRSGVARRWQRLRER
jgi:hypothetical protein